MRIRPAYIVVLILLVIGGFVIYAALSGPDTGSGGPVPPPVSSSSPGILPPVGKAQDQVANIEVETDSFDMGTIANTAPAVKTMTVRNTGQTTLEIKDISTTCGCTTGKITPKEIRPGTSGTLEITVYPNAIPGFFSHKRLTIMSNAPNAPMQNIDVIAHIEREFVVEPEDIDLGTVQKGTSVKREVVFRQLTEEPLEVLDVRPVEEDERAVTFDFSQRLESEWVDPGKAEYVITVTLEPWAPVGEFSKAYEIVSTCKRVPRYRQKVVANVEGFYTVTPPRLSFSMQQSMAAGEPLGSIVVESERPIEIVDPKVTGESFEVKVAPGATPNKATLELHMSANPTTGKQNEEVTFFVKGDDGVLLPNVVPVRGVVVDRQ